MFIDGTAAVFGLLSAIVAIGAIVLAVSGIQGFRSIKNSITEEVNDHVQKELKRQVTEAISGHIQAEIQGKLDILIAAAVKSGETRINAEIARIQVEAAVRNELVEQVAAAVTATLKPQPSRTTQDEFEPPKA